MAERDLVPNAPGTITVDEQGDLHIDVPRLLDYIGWPDTPDNRDVACRIVRETAAVQFPGMPVNVV
jgi:hypothetical protein